MGSEAWGGSECVAHKAQPGASSPRGPGNAAAQCARPAWHPPRPPLPARNAAAGMEHSTEHPWEPAWAGGEGARRAPGSSHRPEKPVLDCLQFLFLGSWFFFFYNEAINPQKTSPQKGSCPGQGAASAPQGVNIDGTGVTLCGKETVIFLLTKGNFSPLQINAFVLK